MCSSSLRASNSDTKNNMMNAILSILFFLTSKVSSLSEAVEPARVYGSSAVKKGDNLVVKCSTFGSNPAGGRVFVYLCKNGVGVEVMESKLVDTSFTVEKVTKEHSGNYSCVFSRTKHHLSHVKGEGHNTISVKVIDSLYPANIAVDESRVRKGSDVRFRCSSTDAPDASVLHAYFCRSQTIVDIEMFDSQKKQASFHLRNVQEDDAGSYCCVVSDRLLAEKELEACGNTSVSLTVYEDPPSAFSEVMLPGVYVSLSLACLLLLFLLAWNLGKWKWPCRRHPQVSGNQDGVVTMYTAVFEGNQDTDEAENMTHNEFSDFSDDESSDRGDTEDVTYQETEDNTGQEHADAWPGPDGARVSPAPEVIYATPLRSKKPCHVD
ncbi:uncharacterized protein LOC134068919 [Sardina pilchardus]|uniref:uncharacterized protein LOC134068919 n=1 Tax=Sardina pilchardus TaxID=27697 RepID=UPI002E11285E